MLLFFIVTFLLLIAFMYFSFHLHKRMQIRINDRLNRLIKSDRYKNSIYRIQKINGAYYVLSEGRGKFVDLQNNSRSWNLKNRYYKNCKGTLVMTMNAFDHRCPEAEVITEIEQF